jgi:hypothetical protein
LKAPYGFVDIVLVEVQFEKKGDDVLTMHASSDANAWEGILAIRLIRLIRNP